jgi:hypothetical protein
MEDDLGIFHHEDGGLDRELHSLVREMEYEEAVQRDLAIPACSREGAGYTPRLRTFPLSGLDSHFVVDRMT